MSVSDTECVLKQMGCFQLMDFLLRIFKDNIIFLKDFIPRIWSHHANLFWTQMRLVAYLTLCLAAFPHVF